MSNAECLACKKTIDASEVDTFSTCKCEESVAHNKCIQWGDVCAHCFFPFKHQIGSLEHSKWACQFCTRGTGIFTFDEETRGASCVECMIGKLVSNTYPASYKVVLRDLFKLTIAFIIYLFVLFAVLCPVLKLAREFDFVDPPLAKTVSCVLEGVCSVHGLIIDTVLSSAKMVFDTITFGYIPQ